jgi:hypothetical protein
MRDKNKLNFYIPCAGAQIREAMLRAHERGVEWSRINVALNNAGDDAPDEAIRLLDELKPLPTPPDDIDEMPTSPSLDEKHEAWMRLNRAFK